HHPAGVLLDRHTRRGELVHGLARLGLGLAARLLRGSELRARGGKLALRVFQRNSRHLVVGRLALRALRGRLRGGTLRRGFLRAPLSYVSERLCLLARSVVPERLLRLVERHLRLVQLVRLVLLCRPTLGVTVGGARVEELLRWI